MTMITEISRAENRTLHESRSTQSSLGTIAPRQIINVMITVAEYGNRISAIVILYTGSLV